MKFIARKGAPDIPDVTVNGETIPNLPKRGVMFNVVKPIIDSGVHPDKIAELIHWRKNSLFHVFDEVLDGESVIETLMGEDPGGKVKKYRRFFSKDDEIFYVDGKTYQLTNQWGKGTVDAVEILKNNFPGLAINITPTAR